VKAISLYQPWASLVAVGAKRIETRSWKTSYRGELAIHASKGFPVWAREMLEWPSLVEALAPLGVRGATDWKLLPTGGIVAVVRLVDVVSTDSGDPRLPKTGELEYFVGDYGPRRFAWFLEDARQLDRPVPILGALGLWSWDVDELTSDRAREVRRRAQGALFGEGKEGPSRAK
jgi:hypothetical protein